VLIAVASRLEASDAKNLFRESLFCWKKRPPYKLPAADQRFTRQSDGRIPCFFFCFPDVMIVYHSDGGLYLITALP